MSPNAVLLRLYGEYVVLTRQRRAEHASIKPTPKSNLEVNVNLSAGYDVLPKPGSKDLPGRKRISWHFGTPVPLQACLVITTADQVVLGDNYELYGHIKPILKLEFGPDFVRLRD